MLQNFGSNCLYRTRSITHQFVYKAKEKSKERLFWERESKDMPTATKSRIHMIFWAQLLRSSTRRKRSCSQICEFRLGTECLELSIFCTLKHRRVQKRVHYFCRVYAPSTTSASLFLPWPRSFCPLNASLPLVSLPLVSVAALWSVQ